MLLRRILNHLKSQNLIPAFLDLLIVFVGIFAAFQVDRWYEGRQGQSRERAHLQSLAADFEASRIALESNIGLHRGSINASVLLAEDVTGTSELGNDDFYELMRNVQYMGSWVPQRRAYDALVDSGEITLITDEELKSDLAEYFSRSERAVARRDELSMQRVTIFEPYVIEHLDHAALVKAVHPNISESLRPSLPMDQYLQVLGTQEFEGVITSKMHASHDATSFLGQILELNLSIERRLSELLAD
jgi:hypothetical protein